MNSRTTITINALALSIALALGFSPTVLHAQSTTSVQISIPAQSLNQALLQLGQQTDIQIYYLPETVAGFNAPAVSGKLTAEQALRTLLQGTGVLASWNGKRVSLTSGSAEPAQLSSIKVVGSGMVSAAPSIGKIDQALMDIPQSVSIVTREEMDRRAVQTITEAVQYTPGVSVDGLGMDNQTEWISLRGFSAPSSYLDGLRLDPTWQSEPFGLEQVEILRGPASVLYGESVPGGLTGLVSKRPSFSPSGEAQFQLGNQNRVQGALDVTGPVDEAGKWAYRVVGLARDSDTAVDYVKNDRLFIAPSLTWRPTAATSLTLLTQHQRDKIGFLPQYLPASGTLNFNPNGEVPRHRYVGEPDRENYLRTQSSVGYIFDHAVSDAVQIQQTARYARMHQAFDSVTGNGLLADQRTLKRRLYDADQTSHDFSIDTRATTRFTTGPLAHTVLTGIEFARKRYDSMQWICGSIECAPTLDLFSPEYGQAINRPETPSADVLQKQERLGVYAQDQIKFGKLTMTAGGRWDSVKQSTFDRLSDTMTRSRDYAFTGRAGMAYSFDNGVTPYVSYAESFQPISGLLYPSSPAKPMTGRQYELGIKFQPQGQDSFVGLSVYDLRQQNMTTTDPDNPGFIVQSAQTKVQGIELEAKLAVTRQFDLIASYTFTDARYSRSNDGYEGNQVSGTPRSQAAAWGDYRFTGDLTGLSAGMGVRYVGGKYGNSSNTVSIPSYTLLDAALRYDLGKLGGAWRDATLSINVNNLLDKDYVATCLSNTRCYFGAPRTVMATLAYRW